MREIDVKLVTETVRDLYIKSCVKIGEDLKKLIEKAAGNESGIAKETLCQILQNAGIAERTGLPLCQDTGLCVVFIDIGQDVHFYGGDLGAAVDEGVRRACLEGSLRASSVSPLERVNTGDNTPAVTHVRIVPGDGVNVTVAPKGFGSENMSRIAMLSPSDGIEGVKDFIVETVRLAGGRPCPPIIAGVGIGGTMESCALLAKRMLLRPPGQPAEDITLVAMESGLLARINALKIGPMGLGGNTTALAVHIGAAHTHIAGLPVAVNLQCHASRHMSASI